MMPVQFSVVIPLYNNRSSILAALRSVLDQRFAANEIIVVDDGSTDGGADTLANLKVPNLKLVKQHNQGVSVARNHGVALATCPYVAFLDADDQWTPFFLHEMQALIRRFPGNGLYACRYQKLVDQQVFEDAKIRLNNLTPEGYEMHDFFDIAGKGDLPFMVSSTVVNRDYFNQSGGFPVGEWMGEDQSFFTRAALDKTIAYSPQIRLLYHTDSENRASDKRTPGKLCPFAQRLQQVIAEERLHSSEKRAMERYISAHICDLAKRNVKAGYPKDARALLSHRLSNLKPVHRAYWYAQSWLKSMLLLNQENQIDTVINQHTNQDVEV